MHVDAEAVKWTKHRQISGQSCLLAMNCQPSLAQVTSYSAISLVEMLADSWRDPGNKHLSG